MKRSNAMQRRQGHRSPAPEPESEQQAEETWMDDIYGNTNSLGFAPMSNFLSRYPNPAPLSRDSAILVVVRKVFWLTIVRSSASVVYPSLLFSDSDTEKCRRMVGVVFENQKRCWSKVLRYSNPACYSSIPCYLFKGMWGVKR